LAGGGTWGVRGRQIRDKIKKAGEEVQRGKGGVTGFASVWVSTKWETGGSAGKPAIEFWESRREETQGGGIKRCRQGLTKGKNEPRAKNSYPGNCVGGGGDCKKGGKGSNSGVCRRVDVEKGGEGCKTI